MRVAAVRPAAGREAAEVLAAAALASSAELVDDDGTLRVVGDPVEGAVLLAALEQGLSRRRLVENRELVAELPFFPSQCWRMTVVYDEPDGRRMFVKGAPEVLLALTDGQIEGPSELESAAQAWAEEGFRALAVAERRLSPDDGVGPAAERDLVPVGILALHDPLRDGAAEAVRIATGAGIRVAMLTGDHPATAHAIAQALGMRPEDVHARVTPAEKLAIVEREQAHGGPCS